MKSLLASGNQGWAVGLPGLLFACLPLFCTPAALDAMQEEDPANKAQESSSADFEDLFDGKSLEGWIGDSDYWSVSDGVIVGESTGANPLEHNTFLIWNGEAADFEIELEFRMATGNSGLQFRSVDNGSFRITGYQADFDAGNNYTGIIYEEGGRGILVPRTQHVTISGDGTRKVSDEATCDEKAFLASIRSGEWNKSNVVAKGSQITHMINGFVTARLDDGESLKSRDKGAIALQLHAGPPMKIEFRNIRLKRLE